MQLLSYIKNNFLSLHACATNRWMLFTGFDAMRKKRIKNNYKKKNREIIFK
jgi:hypothetical protein